MKPLLALNSTGCEIGTFFMAYPQPQTDPGLAMNTKEFYLIGHGIRTTAWGYHIITGMPANITSDPDDIYDSNLQLKEGATVMPVDPVQRTDYFDKLLNPYPSPPYYPSLRRIGVRIK